MIDRSIAAEQSEQVKNRPFRKRLGFASAGIMHVWGHESSFRTQSASAVAALISLAMLRPPLIWWALVVVASALVLALELMNSALEYVCDGLHPGLCDAIKHAKDAAAGAVLVASLCAVIVGILMMVAHFRM